MGYRVFHKKCFRYSGDSFVSIYDQSKNMILLGGFLRCFSQVVMSGGFVRWFCQGVVSGGLPGGFVRWFCQVVLSYGFFRCFC